MSSNADLAEKVDQAPKKKDALDHIQEKLNLTEKQFALALADEIPAGKFIRVAFNEIRRNPNLQKASWPSLAGALMASAQLGLEPGGPLQQAHLVPYGKEVKLIIDYKGYEQLAYRSGMVASINAHAVREKDAFDYEYGTNAFIRHKPVGGDRGEVVASYCVARLVTGGDVFTVLHKEDIEARRKLSANSSGKDSPWVKQYDRMARKSAIRALFPDLPSSTHTQRALGYDERTFASPSDADLGEPGEGEVIDVEGEEV